MQVLTARRAGYPLRNYGYVIKTEPVVTMKMGEDVEGVGFVPMNPQPIIHQFLGWYRDKKLALARLRELLIEKSCASCKPSTRLQILSAKIRAERLADPRSLFWKGSKAASRKFEADLIRSDRELMGNAVCRKAYRNRA